MANLRTNNLSGEQGQNAIRGAVNFGGYVDGSASDYLSVADNDDLDMGTGDFTFECWLLATEHVGTNTPNPMGIISSQSWTAGGILIQVRGADDPSGVLRVVVPLSGGGYLDVNGSTDFYNVQGRDWVHIAVVRTSGTLKGYVNGIQEISTSYSVAVDFAHGGTCTIGENGYDQYPGDYSLRGTISNLRLTKGLARYTSTFTPPAFELTADADTVLLCCQNSDDVTQEETGKTITGVGNLATADYNKSQPKVIPPYGVDAGNTFGGPIQQSTEGYMYFPIGGTEERGRGRAVSWLGADSPNYTKQIDFFDIQSLGTTTKFGEISDTVGLGAAMSSSTRGVFAGGTKPAVGNMNLLEFITIATTGNAVDFGGVSTTFRYGAGISNSTRGLIAGGYQGGGASGTKNVIQFITIASLGDTADFGDMIADSGGGISGAGSCQSSTRGITFGGAGYNPAQINEINHITIGTLGNSVDFGDLSVAKEYLQGVSSSTRGVVAGGYQDSPGFTSTNVIEFITIASTGDAVDFGDLITAARLPGSSGGSNKIRGVFVGGGVHPSYYNTMEFVTIATTGNASDFGDISTGGGTPYGSVAVSDSHGGLS